MILGMSGYILDIHGMRLYLVPTHCARRYTQVSGRHDNFRHPGRDCRDPEAMDGNIEAGTSLATQDCLVKLGIHIPVLSATAPTLLYLLHPCSRGFRQSLPE
jgi:hypothetical protein